ncbi:MAG: ThiF family adenylyltransferase [Pseudobdellovibrionaceae bacterium]|jgi:molybdopterin/thiamine biosynthesis adenylyltransferase|nr:ThiF family adenylyltransferase [Pseudobdellovibrionaceae bacterium]
MSKEYAAPPLPFDYDLAFSRNLGWLTQSEQKKISKTRVAIAGLGGCGGSYLLTMVRLGVKNFHIADMDGYELQNFNRQVGATVETLGKSKVDAIKDMALKINPEIEFKLFPNGLNEENLDEFLEGVDVCMDALDVFVIDLREILYRKLESKKIPSVFGAPFGASVGYLTYMPGNMTFEDYFCLAGCSEYEKRVRFVAGLAPKGLHARYIADKSYVNLEEARGPSLVFGIDLCSGVVGTEALKILLGRGKIFPMPHYQQFDAYRGKFVRGKLPWGMKGPLMRLRLIILKKILKSFKKK